MRQLPATVKREANFRRLPYVPKPADNIDTVIRLLPVGTPLTVAETVEHAESGYTFIHANVDSVWGWVSKSHLSFRDAPTSPRVSGWGLHMMNGASLTGPYNVYKAVEEARWIIEAHRRYPDAMCIYRKWYSQGDQEARLQEAATAGFEAAYQRWYNDNAWVIANCPYAYFEGFNEIGSSDLYLAFEKYRTERLAAIGIKACVLNIATGNTDKAMWRRAESLVATTIRLGAIIGVHCYAEGVITANCNSSYWKADGSWSGGELFPSVLYPDTCFTAFRILQDKANLAAQGQSAAQLVATELFLDDVSFPGNGVYHPLGIKVRGWHDCVQVWERMGWLRGTDPVSFVRKQLDYWQRMTGCLGVVFTSGTSGDPNWRSFEVAGYL